VAALCWLALPRARGQEEVRRAIPVDTGTDNIPTAKAVPFSALESPTPRPANPPAASGGGDDTTPTAPPPPPPAASPDQVQLDYANSYYAKGMVDSAAPEYEKYLSLYPSAPLMDRESAIFRLGECYRRMGNANAAKNAYDNLLLNFEIGPFIGPAAYRLGDMCYQAKDYEGALDYFRKASIRLSDPQVVLAAKFYSARSLEGMNLPSEARVTYEDIIATPGENPYREPSRLALAEILANYDRKPEALDQFEALAKEAEQPPVKVEALVKAGLLNIELNQPAKGAADLNKALTFPEIGQWQPIAQMGLLRVLYQTGKYKDLLAQYDSALDSLPDDLKPEVLVLAANSKRQLNDYQGASDLYNQVVTQYPKSQYADEAEYQNLVSLYNGGAPDLIPQLDKYLAGTPDEARRDQVMLLKAEALFKAQQYAAAAPVYAALQESTLGENFRSDALFKLGWCYMQVHQPAKAIEALTTFLKNYPLNKMAAEALAQRAVAYQQTKDLDSALRDFNELLANYPRTKERELALQQKALILGEQQDEAGMSATFQQLLQEYPRTTAAAQANYWIGSAAFAAKDYKACIQPLAIARKMDHAQFYERATVRIIAAYYTLEDRDSLTREVDDYNNSKPEDKVHPDVLRWLGASYLDSNDYAESEKYLTQLSTRDEVTPDDWLNLGRAQTGAKKYADAIGSINKYLDAQTDPAAKAKGLLDLGQAQLDAGQLDDAQASADKACSLQPEGLPNAQGRMLSGDIQMARANYDGASKLYQSIAVIIDDPQVTPKALEKAYNCLNLLGDKAGASKVLNQLQTKYPEYQLQAQHPAP